MENRGQCFSNSAERLYDRDPSSIYNYVASCLSHVETAWKLVYERYVASGFISSNPHKIHTNEHALTPDSCVILGERDGDVVSTMTLIADSDEGLSLDLVYRKELDGLRTARRKLMEVGLLVGNCRPGESLDMIGLFEMMKWPIYYALHIGISDIVIGVHPHHVKFYTRCFAFEQFGPESVYPVVHNKPVVPLRLQLREQLAHKVQPRGLRYVRDNPVAADAFEKRFAFSSHGLMGSAIERFMSPTHKIDKRSRKPLNLLARPMLQAAL